MKDSVLMKKHIALTLVVAAGILVSFVLAAPASSLPPPFNNYVYITMRGHGKVTDSGTVTCSSPRSSSSTAEVSCTRSDGETPYYVAGSVVTLTANVLDAGDGWTFIGWQGEDLSRIGIYPTHCNGADSSNFYPGSTCSFVKGAFVENVTAIFKDTGAPDTAIASGPAPGSTTNNTSPSFTFSSPAQMPRSHANSTSAHTLPAIHRRRIPV